MIPEAVKRLNDTRWFVKRNMLYILRDLDIREVSGYIRPCCQDKNPKVSRTALECLLNVKDSYAIEAIREHLDFQLRGIISAGPHTLRIFQNKGKCC